MIAPEDQDTYTMACRHIPIRGMLALLVLTLGACIASPPVPSASPSLASPSPSPIEPGTSARPSLEPSLSPSPAWPTPDASLRLMFVTQEDDGTAIVPTRPPVGFSYPDGTLIPAPAWAGGLLQAAGDFLAWSRDARYLAFDGYPMDENGWVEDPRGVTQILLLISEPATGMLTTANPEGLHFSPLAGGPTWSPDSSRLAVPLLLSASMSRDSIYLVSPGGNPTRQITPPGAMFPSWSPLDSRLAYLDYTASDSSCGPFFPDDRPGCDQATLKVLDVDSGIESTLLEGAHVSVETGGWGNVYNAPSWSPDGQWLIVFSGGRDPDLVAVDADSGAQRRLARSVARGAYAAIAPDGGSVAYVSRATGNDEIMLIPWAGGEEQNLTDDPSSDINPVWSPDGRLLAFLSDRADRSRGGGYHLYTLDLLAGDVHQVSEAFVMTRPVWLPSPVH